MDHLSCIFWPLVFLFWKKKSGHLSIFKSDFFCYWAVLVSYVLWILTPNQKDDMQFFFHSVSCLFHSYCFFCFLCFWYHGHKLLQMPMLSSFFYMFSSRSFMSSFIFMFLIYFELFFCEWYQLGANFFFSSVCGYAFSPP